MGINQRVTVIAIVVLIFVLKSILSSSTPPFSTGQALSWNLDEEQFERIKVRNGSKLRLWFKGPKYPSSTITWYKDGKKIKNVTSRLKIKQSSLVILKLEEDDSGEYACYKQNQHGEVWKNYTLTVTTDPLITKPVIQSPLNQTVAYLDDVKFQCKVIMNSTSTNIQWFKHYQVNGSYTNEDGVPYVHVIQSRLNHSSEILYIKNVTYEDAGWYTCLVTNAVGRAYQSAWLTVTVPSTLAKRTIFGTSTLAENLEEKYELPKTAIFLASESALLLIVVVGFAIYKIRARTMQKRRKKYFCIQAIPNSENPPYEAALTYSGGLYLDPYFETHSEQDEGYEFLPVLAETYGDGPYTDPNNADGRYLDVVFSKNGPNDYINAHTYLDLEGDTTYSHSKSNDTGVCQSEVSNSVKDNPGNHTIKSNNDLDDDL